MYFAENGSYHLQVYFVFLRKFIWESNTENTLKGTLAENSTLQTPSWKVFIRNLVISLLSPNVGVSLQTESDAIPKQEQPWGRKVKVKTCKKEPIPIFKEELSKFKWAQKNLLNTFQGAEKCLWFSVNNQSKVIPLVLIGQCNFNLLVSAILAYWSVQCKKEPSLFCCQNFGNCQFNVKCPFQRQEIYDQIVSFLINLNWLP